MLLPGQTRFGPRRTAIQRRLRRFHNRRIVRALAFYQGWWGVRPNSPVTSQPPRLVDLLYREDPHILCFREACQQPSLPSLFGMPHGHSLSCLLIRRYRMSAVTFCLLLCVPRYQLAQTPVSPHGAAGQQKQTLLLSCFGKILVFCSREACQQLSFPSLFGMPYGHSFHASS